MKIKMLSMAVGAAGAAVAAFFGGLPKALIILVAFMAIDYGTGILLALVFHKSQKTETGAASSRVALMGFARKIGVASLYALGFLIDKAVGKNVFADFVAIGLMFYEAISIVENVGLMGVPIPNWLLMGIDVLRQKAEEPKNGFFVKAEESEGNADADH